MSDSRTWGTWRTWLAWGALITGTLASATLLLRARETPDAADAAPQLGVGYYMKDATLTGTGEDGHILYRMHAVSVVQSATDGSAQMKQVDIDYSPAGDLPWTLRADTGRMLPDGKMLGLSGNVVATTRDRNEPVATITTDHLQFDPETDTVTTTQPVVIEYAGSVLHGTGLRALLREERMQLLADVRGRYVR